MNNTSLVPWEIRNHWKNSLYLARSMSFLIGHIYREGNSSADLLASQTTILDGFFWRDSCPSFIQRVFVNDRNARPNFRI